VIFIGAILSLDIALWKS